jgi:hypothetical protein
MVGLKSSRDVRVVDGDLIGVYLGYEQEIYCGVFSLVVVTPTKRWTGCTQLRMGRLLCRFHCFAITQNTFEYSTQDAIDATSSLIRTPDVTAALNRPDSMESQLPGFESLWNPVYS